MYSCKVCKGTAVRAATLSGSNTPNSSITRYNKSAVCLLLLKNQIVKIVCVNFTNFLARGTNPRIITNLPKLRPLGWVAVVPITALKTKRLAIIPWDQEVCKKVSCLFTFLPTIIKF